jgi:hypothetical protein
VFSIKNECFSTVLICCSFSKFLFFFFFLPACTLKPAHSVTFHYVALDWMTATRDTDISFCLPTDLTMSAAVSPPSSCLAVDQGHQERTHCHSQPSVSLRSGTRIAVNTGADKALLNPLIIISPSQLVRCTYRQCRIYWRYAAVSWHTED